MFDCIKSQSRSLFCGFGFLCNQTTMHSLREFRCTLVPF
ncbi:Uncharacterised protein [Vibrio cholerae]|nr:Uncharacterised protein [Vibrio cholerae]